MNKERLKLIVRNLELLTQSLKEELEMDEIVEYSEEKVEYSIDDYDEVFYDNED
jgi:hypothetical protein